MMRRAEPELRGGGQRAVQALLWARVTRAPGPAAAAWRHAAQSADDASPPAASPEAAAAPPAADGDGRPSGSAAPP
eukprot:gene55436-43532_t